MVASIITVLIALSLPAIAIYCHLDSREHIRMFPGSKLVTINAVIGALAVVWFVLWAFFAAVVIFAA